MGTINDRIRELRKALGMTQEEFAKILCIKGSAMSRLENGDYGVTERNIHLLLSWPERNINEKWLRTGEGEMFEELSDDELIAAFVAKVLAKQGDDFKKRALKMLSSLDEDGWRALEIITKRIKEEG